MRVQTTVTASGEADRAGDRKGDGTAREEGPSESLSALTRMVFRDAKKPGLTCPPVGEAKQKVNGGIQRPRIIVMYINSIAAINRARHGGSATRRAGRVSSQIGFDSCYGGCDAAMHLTPA